MKEVRVLVNGKFMWSIKVDQSEDLNAVARRCADAMNLVPKHVQVSLGQVNLVTLG